MEGDTKIIINDYVDIMYYYWKCLLFRHFHRQLMTIPVFSCMGRNSYRPHENLQVEYFVKTIFQYR